MNLFRYLSIIFASAFLFVACDCKKSCPAFNTSKLSYIPYNEGQSIRFANELGQTIIFNVTTKEVDGSHEEKVDRTEPDKCPIINCSAGAQLNANTATFRNNTNLLQIDVQDSEDMLNTPSSFRLFDFSGGFNTNQGGLSTSYTSKNDDYIINNLTLGKRTYQSVLVSTADTLDHPDQQIWQVYFCADGGVIGFRDRQTHSLFYLE